VRNDFRHEQFERWRFERHAMAKSTNAATLAPWITLDVEETVALFLKDVPDARPHAEALAEYLRMRYPHGVHVRSNSMAVRES
jgi:hypothetical protein